MPKKDKATMKTTRMNDDRLKWYNEGHCDSDIAEKVGTKTIWKLK